MEIPGQISQLLAFGEIAPILKSFLQPFVVTR